MIEIPQQWFGVSLDREAGEIIAMFDFSNTPTASVVQRYFLFFAPAKNKKHASGDSPRRV